VSGCHPFTPNGRFGLFATNADKKPAAVELRAFQVPP
jgi:hypothetical protein